MVELRDPPRDGATWSHPTDWVPNTGLGLWHLRYGPGVIVHASEQRIRVCFADLERELRASDADIRMRDPDRPGVHFIDLMVAALPADRLLRTWSRQREADLRSLGWSLLRDQVSNAVASAALTLTEIAELTGAYLRDLETLLVNDRGATYRRFVSEDVNDRFGLVTPVFGFAPSGLQLRQQNPVAPSQDRPRQVILGRLPTPAGLSTAANRTRSPDPVVGGTDPMAWHSRHHSSIVSRRTATIPPHRSRSRPRPRRDRGRSRSSPAHVRQLFPITSSIAGQRRSDPDRASQ
jgi:hypothetical protein